MSASEEDENCCSCCCWLVRVYTKEELVLSDPRIVQRVKTAFESHFAVLPASDVGQKRKSGRLEMIEVIDEQREERERRSIALLHEYNERKDVALHLLGILARRQQVTVKSLYSQFGLDLSD